MKQKNTKIWLTLLIIPIPLLMLNSIIQVIFRGLNNGHGNIVMNILSALIGMGGVLLLISSPAWLYLYIKATNANKVAPPASQPPTPVAPPSNGPVNPQ